MSVSKTRALVIDDQPLFVLSIETTLQACNIKPEIHHAMNGKEAIELINRKNFDIIFLEIKLKNYDAYDLLNHMIRYKKQRKIVILSSINTRIYSKIYLKKGVAAFIHKSVTPEAFITMVKDVLEGKFGLVAPSHNQSNFTHFKKSKSNPFERLSDREKEVLRYMLSGLRVKEISYILNLQSNTISTQKVRIFRKLQIDNMIQLFQLAQQYDLINES